MSFWQKTSFVIALCFWALSCKPSPTAKISLDFSSLIYQAAIENSRVDEITLSIIGTDPPFELHETYKGDTDLIELSLDPGRNLEFTIQTFQQDDGKAHINYEGKQVATLFANTVSTLTIDVHKVGSIQGTISAAINLSQDHNVDLYFVPKDNANSDQTISLTFTDNSFTAVAPLGDYILQGTSTQNEQDFDLVTDIDVEVLHGALTQVDGIFFCTDSNGLCKEEWACSDFDNDDIPHCADDCSIFILPDTTTGCVPKTCGNGIVESFPELDIEETCDGDCPTECPVLPGCETDNLEGYPEMCSARCCGCEPGSTYCEPGEEPQQLFICSASGTNIEVTDCPFRCASPDSICIDNIPVTNFTATVSNGEVTLDWNPVEHQTSSVPEYKIEWWREEFEWSILASTEGTSYGPFSPGPDGNYAFRVRAIDAEIEMAYSVEVDLTFDTTPPTLVSLSPTSENTNVALSPTLKVEYSEPIQFSSVTFNDSGSIQPCNNSHTIWLQKAGHDDCYPLVLEEETESQNQFILELHEGIQLSENTLYRFSARAGVLDLAGNGVQIESHEEFTTTVPVSPVTKVYLFRGNETRGNFGPRGTADATCHTSLNDLSQASSCSKVFAFVSFSDDDKIKTMHERYVFDPSVSIWSLTDGIQSQIASSWNNLFETGLTVNLEDTGIFGFGTQGGEPDWWSGSNQDGTYSSQNCNGWTTESDDVEGMFGDGRKVDLNWLSDGSTQCNNLNWLLCACTSTSE